jgi:site-specific recombinase XerD
MAQTEDVRMFLAHLFDRNLQSSTIQGRLFALRVFYDFLNLGGQVSTVPPRYVLTRKVPKRLPHAISEEEIDRLIAAASNSRDMALLELGYATGMRRSELANLRVEDVNLESRTLIVREGKGGSDRLALFGQKAADALRNHLGARTTGHVFQPLQAGGGVSRDRHGAWRGYWYERDANGWRKVKSVRLGDYELPTVARAREALRHYLERNVDPRHFQIPAKDRKLSDKQIERIIKQAARRAGLKDIHPHVLRHSCATHCLNHGMDVRFVQELLGHASCGTTAKYLHVAITGLQMTHGKFHPHGNKP